MQGAAPHVLRGRRRRGSCRRPSCPILPLRGATCAAADDGRCSSGSVKGSTRVRHPRRERGQTRVRPLPAPGAGFLLRLRGRDAEKRERRCDRRGDAAAHRHGEPVRQRLPRPHGGGAHRAARQAARERRDASRSSRTPWAASPPTRPVANTIKELLTGPTAVTFCGDDLVAPPRRCRTSRKHASAARGARRRCCDASLIDADGVKALASLPSRDVLLAQVVGTMAAPLTGLVTVLQGTIAASSVPSIRWRAEDRGRRGLSRAVHPSSKAFKPQREVN